MPSEVNSQITDSIADVNLETIGSAPAVALGNLYQATAQALANAAHNATVAQQQGNQVGAAVTAQAVALILSINFPKGGK